MHTQITDRERQILQGLADGANSKDLAQMIGRSRGTVEAEIRVLFSKFEARSRHHLVAQAFRHGVLSAGGVRTLSDQDTMSSG
jgi:LuxR family transcriptional regulator